MAVLQSISVTGDSDHPAHVILTAPLCQLHIEYQTYGFAGVIIAEEHEIDGTFSSGPDIYNNSQ